MVAIPLRLIGVPTPLPSPLAEALTYLQQDRSHDELKALGFLVSQILEQLPTPYREQLEFCGNTWHWVGESDLRRFWQAVQTQNLEDSWRMYGLLLPGSTSQLPEFKTWLEAERACMLGGLLGLCHTDPALVESLVNHELQNPTDETRALAAYLLRAESQIRQRLGKAAVLTLAPALGLHELMGQEFSGVVLAQLAEAHALWAHRTKAQQTAQKALERSSDPYSRSRAFYARYRATGQPSDLEHARRESQAAKLENWAEYLAKLNP